jgi:hypothetical protein
MEHNCEKMFHLNTIQTIDENKVYFKKFVVHGKESLAFETLCIGKYRIKIDYCPFCGVKLGDING